MENRQIKQLKERIESTLKHTEWEVENTERHSKAWTLLTGKCNGYKHVLEIINSIEFDYLQTNNCNNMRSSVWLFTFTGYTYCQGTRDRGVGIRLISFTLPCEEWEAKAA